MEIFMTILPFLPVAIIIIAFIALLAYGYVKPPRYCLYHFRST